MLVYLQNLKNLGPDAPLEKYIYPALTLKPYGKGDKKREGETDNL